MLVFATVALGADLSGTLRADLSGVEGVPFGSTVGGWRDPTTRAYDQARAELGTLHLMGFTAPPPDVQAMSRPKSFLGQPAVVVAPMYLDGELAQFTAMVLPADVPALLAEVERAAGPPVLTIPAAPGTRVYETANVTIVTGPAGAFSVSYTPLVPKCVELLGRGCPMASKAKIKADYGL